MQKVKLLFTAAVLSALITSCGIFHKSCNCPHFSNNGSTKKQVAVA